MWSGAGGGVHRIGCAATGASNASSGTLSADSSAASGLAAVPAPTVATLAPGAEERRGGGGVKRLGAPLGETTRGGARRLDECCPLDREFEGLSLSGG